MRWNRVKTQNNQQLEALRARVHVEPEPEPVNGALNIDAAVRAVLAERERAEAEARRRAEAERFKGGPCGFCGVEESTERGIGGAIVGQWYDRSGRPVCTWCDETFRNDGVNLTDDEHRDRVLRDLLRGHPELPFWSGPHLARKTEFRWWHESGAGAAGAGGGTTRFAYIDRARLDESLRPASAGTPYLDGEPCGGCGCAHMWVLVPESTRDVEVREGTKTTHESTVVPAHHSCRGCASIRDMGEVVEKLVGLRYNADFRTLGVGWFKELPAGDPRRKLTQAPFMYLGDLGELRRRAFEAHPDQRHWRAFEMWRRLRDEASRGSVV